MVDGEAGHGLLLQVSACRIFKHLIKGRAVQHAEHERRAGSDTASSHIRVMVDELSQGLQGFVWPLSLKDAGQMWELL